MESKQKKFPTNMTTLFYDTQIFDPVKKENILFKTLWENNKKPLLLVHWLRRFGCPICRLSSLELCTGLINTSEENIKKFNHISIGLSLVDFESFEQGNYFKNGSIYVDEERATFKALKFQRLGISTGYGMLNPNMYFKGYEAKKNGIEGTSSNTGDGFQLGGTLVIERNGNVIFYHIQENYTDVPNIEGIIQSVEEYIENKYEFNFLGAY